MVRIIFGTVVALAMPFTSVAQTSEIDLAQCAALYHQYDGHVHQRESENSKFAMTFNYEMRADVAELHAKQLGQTTEWPQASTPAPASSTEFMMKSVSLGKCDEQLGFVPNSHGDGMFTRRDASSIERPDNLACFSMMVIAASQMTGEEESDKVAILQEHANSMFSPIAQAGWAEAHAEDITQVVVDIFSKRYADEGPVNPLNKLAGEGEIQNFSRQCLASWPRQAESEWTKIASADEATKAPQAETVREQPTAVTYAIGPKSCTGIETLLDEVKAGNITETRAMPSDISAALFHREAADCSRYNIGLNAGGSDAILRCASPGATSRNTTANKSKAKSSAVSSAFSSDRDLTMCTGLSDWTETSLTEDDLIWGRIGRNFTSPDGQWSVAYVETRRAQGAKSLSDQKVRTELWLGAADTILEVDYVPY